MTDRWIPNPRPFPTVPPRRWPDAGAPTPQPAPVGDPPDPEHEERHGRAAMILGVIGVALAAAIVTYVVLRLIKPPEERVVPPMTTVATSTTTTTLPEGPAITSTELAGLVDELVPFVEDARQLTFRDPPKVELLDEAGYGDALETHLAAADEWLERLEVPFDALGLNANDADIGDAVRAFVGDKSVVFYDPVTQVASVRAVPATPYLSAMLVVELTETLDDQHFDTAAVASPVDYGDPTFGPATLAGGDAWRIASQWADTQSMDDQVRIRDELVARRGHVGDTARVPSALAEWLRYPAENGVRFTAGMVTSNSSGPLDAAFRNPPDGSAQVLSPIRFTNGTAQLPVAVPSVDGDVVSSGTFGRLFLEAALGPVVPDEVVARALNGYRGDTLVAYDSSDAGSCIRLDITTGDAPPDSMHDAVGTFAAERDGTVTLVDDPDRSGRELVRLDLCSGGGSSPDSTTTTTPGAAPGTDPSSTIPGGPLP